MIIIGRNIGDSLKIEYLRNNDESIREFINKDVAVDYLNAHYPELTNEEIEDIFLFKEI